LIPQDLAIEAKRDETCRRSLKGDTPAFLAKSAQAIENKQDDLPKTARECGKSVEV
jgi:hypothetical protein